MGIERIAAFVKGITFERLPEKAVGAAKIPLLDCLGVAVAGSFEPASRIVVKYLAECGGSPEAGLIGAGFKTSVAQAAWVNATTAHILDYDDYYLPYHPTVAILPAVLAIAEKYHRSGKDILLAYITGFEVQASIAAVMGRVHYEQGWHSTSLLGSLGATAASSKILGLDEDQVRMSLGIAGSLAGGLRKNFGSMTKSLHAGNAARNGVVAAMLARGGFTADDNILAGKMGFTGILGSIPGSSLSDMSAELGKRYYISSVGISIKPYPSCAGTHWAIEAALDLRRELGNRIKDIAVIECVTGPEVPRILIHSRPANALEGKFSMEYCIAVALLDGQAQLKQFSDQRLQDPALQQLLRKIQYSHPTRMGKGLGDEPCEMLVKLQDGSILVRKETSPRGTPQNPVTRREAAQKFLGCVEGRLSAANAHQAIEQIFNLESVEDIAGLMDIFTFLK
jgi:2-methylcitrate dehydratase PrpD